MFNHLQRYGITTLLLILLSLPANGNGINPPRPSGSATIALSCIDRSSGDSTTVLRAKIITGDEPAGWLDVRIGKSAPQRLQLSQIIQIQMPSGKAIANGFTKATLEIHDPDYTGAGWVHVKNKGKPIRISGFTPTRERIELPLDSCKKITQSTQQASETPSHSISKH